VMKMTILRDLESTTIKFLYCPVCEKQYQKKAWFEQHIQESIDSHALVSGGKIFFQTELEEFFNLEPNLSLKERLTRFFEEKFKQDKDQDRE